MSVFAISDIHGSLDLFEKALEKIDFSKDKLIVLGDYCDAGINPMGVVLKLIELKSMYPDKIITLMGNHDIFFLDDYEIYFRDGQFKSISSVWHQNIGSNTAISFNKLSPENQKNVYSFMSLLRPFHIEEINGKKYCFVHAFISKERAISNSEHLTYFENKYFFNEITWDRTLRYMYEGDTLNEFENNYDDNFIIVGGHNINPEGKAVVGTNFIRIDCGAKVLNPEAPWIDSCCEWDSSKTYREAGALCLFNVSENTFEYFKEETIIN